MAQTVWVRRDAITGDDVSQKSDVIDVKETFADLQVEVVGTEVALHLIKDVVVGFLGLGENENIIDVDCDSLDACHGFLQCPLHGCT